MLWFSDWEGINQLDSLPLLSFSSVFLPSLYDAFSLASLRFSFQIRFFTFRLFPLLRAAVDSLSLVRLFS
jgi:hypothetical protein